MILTFWKKSQCFTSRKRKKTRKTPDFTDYAVDCRRRRRFYPRTRPRKNRVAEPNLSVIPIIRILRRRRRTPILQFVPIALLPLRRFGLTFFHIPTILTLDFAIYRRVVPKNESGGFCEISAVVYNRERSTTRRPRDASRLVLAYFTRFS